MKKFTLFFAVLAVFAFGAANTIEAQTEQRGTVKINKQKKFSRSKLTVKFLSLVEDSRCPIGVNCVWAGNAHIKVEISDGRRKEVFDINTNLGARGASFGGFAVNLVELTPVPRDNVRINRNSYQATFTIVRLTR